MLKSALPALLLSAAVCLPAAASGQDPRLDFLRDRLTEADGPVGYFVHHCDKHPDDQDYEEKTLCDYKDRQGELGNIWTYIIYHRAAHETPRTAGAGAIPLCPSHYTISRDGCHPK